jgi:hypothetical protein
VERRDTEEALIKSVVADNADDIGKAMTRQGIVSPLETVKVTEDDTAIVRVTPGTHRAIGKALGLSAAGP